MKALFAVFVASSFCLAAQTTRERDLQNKLTAVQAQLEAMDAREKAAVADGLRKLKIQGSAQTDAVTNAAKGAASGRTDAAASALNADQSAADQYGISLRAAMRAEEAAAIARSQADKIATENHSLVIVQAFTFMGLLVGFIYKAFERRWDLQETIRKEDVAEKQRLEAVELAAGNAKSQKGQLTQIHTLVNSNLTERMASELEALKVTVTLLQELAAMNELKGIHPTPEAESRIASVRAKVAELSSQLADRMEQTRISDQVLINNTK